MTQEQNAKLLQAYRSAIAAGQDGIADMLEYVILGLMGKGTSPIATRTRNATEPPSRVTCGPDIVPLSTTTESTVIDRLSKEGK